MGTRFEIVIPEPEREQLETLFQKIREKVLWWHHRLSRFEPESDISRINREAHGHPVSVDANVFTVLQQCEIYHRKTNGLFDPAILSLQKYWEETRYEGSPEKAATLATCSGWKQVVLDPENSTVTLSSKETGLDAGAFGKGWALREAGILLREAGIHHALLSFGGSSILALGHHPNGPHWPAGITDIFRSYQNIYTFPLRDSALSSSGVSAQRTPAGEHRYLPIIHPKTGIPAQGWKNIVVETPDPFEAEVLSTAFFLADEKEQKSLLQHFKNIIRGIQVEYLNQKPIICKFEILNKQSH